MKLRDVDIWDLRARGHSIQKIAEEMNISQGVVRASLSRVADEYKVESAAEIIKMELDRLDIMLFHAMQILEDKYTAYSHGRMMTDEEGKAIADPQPVLKAIDAVLKIMDRRSRYLGLDAPTRSEQFINVNNQPNDTEIALLSFINDFQQRVAAITPEMLELPAPEPTPLSDIITLPSDHITESDHIPTPIETETENAH